MKFPDALQNPPRSGYSNWPSRDPSHFWIRYQPPVRLPNSPPPRRRGEPGHGCVYRIADAKNMTFFCFFGLDPASTPDRPARIQIPTASCKKAQPDFGAGESHRTIPLSRTDFSISSKSTRDKPIQLGLFGILVYNTTIVRAGSARPRELRRAIRRTVTN